jgi:radical SAM superfamily enzyme YgiQ (UPF0313 family)
MKVFLILPAAEHLRVKQDEPVPKRKMLRFSVLSLTIVAALTPTEHEVTICDENVEAVDFDAKADVVGISFMTGLAPRAYEIADEFRRRGAITVAGGYHPTFCTEESLRHFDIVVAGEAEGVWPTVLKDIERKQFKRCYRGKSSQELSVVPIPRRELLNGKGRYYVTTNAVQTGRGCNHRCKFCSVSAFFEHRYRSRPVEDVLEELKSVPRNFMFVDDNIIADREYAKKLFAAMIPMKKRWISQCSIEIADDVELLRLAREAGCRGLFVGIETISEANLAAVEKGFNDPHEYLRRIRTIRKMGICVQAGIIVGMDSDDVTVFERTLRFLQKARIDALQLAILTPQPGTPLREEFEKAGRIIDNDWSHYDYRHTVIQPMCMSARELQDGADWLYNQFYRLDRIVIRTVRTAFSVGLIPAYLIWRVNLTYRYDNKREGIVGRNPATLPSRWYECFVHSVRNMFARPYVQPRT